MAEREWGGGRGGPAIAEPVRRVEPLWRERPLPSVAPKQRRDRLLWGAFAVGVAFRLYYFQSGRSFWIDEARLAVNVASRGYADLLRPLDYDQAASPLFLWGEKLATQLFGVNERAFWLLPLIAGIAAMLFFIPLARRFLPGWSAAVAAASFFIAPTLVHFSADAKPYIGDLVFALAIMLGTCQWIERPRSPAARALPLIGVLAAWGSLPGIFTLAAAGGALMLGAPPARRWKALLVVGLWLGAFGAAYLLVYGAASHSEYLQRFWRHGFLVPWEPQFFDRFAAARRDLFTAFSVGLYDPPTAPGAGSASSLDIPHWFRDGQTYGSWLLLLVAAIGAAALVRTRARWESVLLVGPVALLAAASALSRYPASTRLVLFLVPVFYLSTAAGGWVLLNALRARHRTIAARVLIGIVFGSQLIMVFRYLRRCPTIENTREMITLLGPVAPAPQVVYVHAGALPAWAFYGTDWAHPDSARLARYARLGTSDGGAFENASSRGRVVLGE
ncbi:MAG TPA: glycosyltransferase family 39 protein, partial [Gemmatimonadales bacterium]|nr:glycosyltransferase family 39 protein [Gemmatimonadales bacterium]